MAITENNFRDALDLLRMQYLKIEPGRYCAVYPADDDFDYPITFIFLYSEDHVLMIGMADEFAIDAGQEQEAYKYLNAVNDGLYGSYYLKKRHFLVECRISELEHLDSIEYLHHCMALSRQAIFHFFEKTGQCFANGIYHAEADSFGPKFYDSEEDDDDEENEEEPEKEATPPDPPLTSEQVLDFAKEILGEDYDEDYFKDGK